MRQSTMLLALAIGSASGIDAQGVVQAMPQDTAPVAVVRAYVEAFNAKDLDGMMARVAPDMVWLHVSGDSLVVGGRGAEAFRRLLDRYFREVPTARSELREARALGPWVTTHDRTRWSASPSGAGEQSSVAVYEVRTGLVRRVWYYPAIP
jgi:uncharacterized protein (TIGR02246 family)